MENITIINNDINEVIKLINKHRNANKNKWYTFSVTINNKNYIGKAYNTWIQILRDEKYNYASCMDISVKDFKEHLFQSMASKL